MEFGIDEVGVVEDDAEVRRLDGVDGAHVTQLGGDCLDPATGLIADAALAREGARDGEFREAHMGSNRRKRDLCHGSGSLSDGTYLEQS